MKIAIITGASSGLGREYFNKISVDSDIEQIWLIARRENVLKELAAKTDKPCTIIAADLTEPSFAEKIEGLLTEHNPDIKMLINNAGFGKLGNVDELEYTDQAKMISLNNIALTVMTAICLPYMQKDSFVLNVCSIASFAPNPRMTVYCSTKAYVLSFSKSLREELKTRGINVIAVCPGPMNTEFLPVAGINGNSKTFNTLPYCNPEKVAAVSLKKATKGRAVYTPRLFFKFYRIIAKLLPHNLIMKISKA